VIREFRFVISSIALTALAVGSTGLFHAGAASDYAHQSSDEVTIGAKSLSTGDEVADVFGKKVDFLKYGVLPVLVVIENKRQKTLDLRDVEVNLVAADGRHVSSVNPEDVPFLGTAGHHPHKSPVPLPIPLPGKKNPLNSLEIVTRAFSAKMLPPGDSVSGFFTLKRSRSPGIVCT
jgi:hypothetical protein